ncbi:hypothetical protein [Iamia sp.]|uniref:hypothetical protein n=1 Tax=Iamia sp. TaxID=2722710 RepID=UPI002C622D43|nr:hypothetical protein [Iamia sp.]HXH59442.1 hypothetical protein [Iamia sp.]
MRFLGDHTGARRAHIIADAENAASRRVAASLDARVTEQWPDGHGRTMIRHVLSI